MAMAGLNWGRHLGWEKTTMLRLQKRNSQNGGYLIFPPGSGIPYTMPRSTYFPESTKPQTTTDILRPGHKKSSLRRSMGSNPQ